MDQFRFDKDSLIRLETSLSLIGRKNALIKVANKMTVMSMETGISIEHMVNAFQEASVTVDRMIPSEIRMQFIYELCENIDSFDGVCVNDSLFNWVEDILDRHNNE